MALQNIDIEGGLRRLADRKIEEAMREGKFDRLPGMGRPMVLDPIPADENARLTWWCLRIMKNNDFTPDEVRMRKQVDRLKAELADAKNKTRWVALVNAINALVRRINTLGTNALNSPMAPVSMESELRALNNGR